MIKIANYLDKERIIFLGIETRDEALSALVSVLHTLGKIPSQEEFFQALIDRESLVSTGIGMGIAIPHAKLPSYDDFFIAIAVLTKGVDWNSLDGAPVRLVVMIGGPDDKQTEYLQILSTLTSILKDEEIRKKILTLKSPIAIMEIFQEY